MQPLGNLLDFRRSHLGLEGVFSSQMEKIKVKITGMSCQSCVSHAKKALEAVHGVRSAVVNLERQEAIVQHEGADVGKLVGAVVGEGYEAWVET